jgi:hypothetical protein
MDDGVVHYTVDELEWRNQAGHEVDLAENVLKEEAAEMGEGCVAEIAPTFEIIRPSLVRRLQVLEMGGIFVLWRAVQAFSANSAGKIARSGPGIRLIDVTICQWFEGNSQS